MWVGSWSNMHDDTETMLFTCKFVLLANEYSLRDFSWIIWVSWIKGRLTKKEFRYTLPTHFTDPFKDITYGWWLWISNLLAMQGVDTQFKRSFWLWNFDMATSQLKNESSLRLFSKLCRFRLFLNLLSTNWDICLINRYGFFDVKFLREIQNIRLSSTNQAVALTLTRAVFWWSHRIFYKIDGIETGQCTLTHCTFVDKFCEITIESCFYLTMGSGGNSSNC